MEPLTPDQGRRPSWLGWSVLALAAAWLLSPVLAAQHLEGYTANLKAIAHMANLGDARGQDLLMPALTDFFYFSRVGVIALLQLGERVFGPAGDWDFRLLMIASLAVLVGGSILIARGVEGIRPLASATALLLIPSVSENAFFFNDNMPSAAFPVAAVALVVRSDRPLTYVLAGLLAAYAVLCRTDAVLLAPFISGIALIRHPSWRPWLVRSTAALGGFLLGLMLGALLLKATPLDAVLASTRFAVGFRAPTNVLVLLLFVSAAGAILLPLGVWVSWQRFRMANDRWRRGVVLLGYPALLAAVAFFIGTETRYVYPLLTPFVAIYGGRGIEALVAELAGRRRRLAMGAVAALALIVLLPPATVIVRDGPRSPTGRLWAPVLWWQWEQAMAGSLTGVEQTIGQARSTPLTVIISTHFNDEFFLKQRLLAAGWLPTPAQAAFPGCSGFSAYHLNGSTLAHVRTEQEYGLMGSSMTRMRAFLLDRSLACAALRTADRTVLTTWGRDNRVQDYSHSFDPRLVRAVLPSLQPLAALSVRLTPADTLRLPPWRPRQADESVPRRQLQGTYHTRDLPPAVVNQLALDAAAFLRRPLQPASGGVDALISWPAFVDTYRARCVDPGRADWRQLPLCLDRP